MTVDGYYDDDGQWQRLKLCNFPCQNCTCQPPMGVYQLKGPALEAHQKECRALRDRDQARGAAPR